MSPYKSSLLPPLRNEVFCYKKEFRKRNSRAELGRFSGKFPFARVRIPRSVSFNRKLRFLLNEKGDPETTESPYFQFLQLILSNDLLLIVRSACFAHSMRHHQFAAFAAFYQIWCAHFPVCSSFISSSFGWFILWTDGHTLHLLKLAEYIAKGCHSRV